MAILIYHCSAWPESAPLPPHWLAELPPGKRAELVRSQPGRRRESVIGLRLLAHGMHALGHTDFELSEVCFGAGLKPEAGRGIDFSISHSGGLAACALHAIAGQPVGLDVERIRAVGGSTFDAYLPPIAPPRKRSVQEVFDLWTRGESVVKAAGGAGLARLREVRYDANDAPIAHFDGRRWHTQRVDLGSRFAAHVTTQVDGSGQDSAPVIRTANVTWQELCRPVPCASESAR